MPSAPSYQPQLRDPQNPAPRREALDRDARSVVG